MTDTKLVQPVGRLVNHNSGDYGYQYSIGLTIVNTSKRTATMMSMAPDIIGFTMLVYRTHALTLGWPPAPKRK